MHRPGALTGAWTKMLSRAPLAILLCQLVAGLACATTRLATTEPESSTDEMLDDSSADSTGTQVFRVMATDSISEKDLGRPCDERFQFLSGEAGQPIFDTSDPRPQAETSAGYFEFGNTRQVDVALGIWGVSVGTAAQHEQWYGLYRMYETTKVREVDDRGKTPRALPDGAQWYVGAIYFGYSVEELAWGSRRSFHAGISARLGAKDLGLGRFHAIVNRYELSNRIKARGLEGTEQQQLHAIKSLTDLASYRKAQAPVPILVEYRSVPGVQPDLGEAIEPASVPPSFYVYAVQLESVHVADPRQCRDGCNVVVSVRGSGSGDEGKWFEGPRGTADPPFGGRELIPSATAEELRQGFTVQVQNDAPGRPGLGLCQLTMTTEQLDNVAKTPDKVIEIEQNCAPFVILKLRLLAKEQSIGS